MTEMPSEVTYGYVTGKFILAIGDGSDEDRLPDARPASGLQVTFTPINFDQAIGDAIIMRQPLEAFVGTDGLLREADTADGITGDEGEDGPLPGIWLIAGTYKVTFKGLTTHALPKPYAIDVLPTHTEEAPLDLASVTPLPAPSPQAEYVRGVGVNDINLSSDGENLVFSMTDGTTHEVSYSGTSVTPEVTITAPTYTVTAEGDYVAGVTTTVTLPTEATIALTVGQFIIVRKYGQDWFAKVASLDNYGTEPATVVLPIGPVWTDDVANGGGTWSTPTQEGLTYAPSGLDQTVAPGAAISWTVSALPGYEIQEGATTAWSHTFPLMPEPFELVHLDYLAEVRTDTSTFATHTFENVDFGTPRDGRVILIGLISHGVSVSSVSIGGVAAERYASGPPIADSQGCWAVAVVPDGATGDVVVSTQSATFGLTIDVFNLTGAESHIPYRTALVPQHIGSITIPSTPAGGMAVGLPHRDAGDPVGSEPLYTGGWQSAALQRFHQGKNASNQTRNWKSIVATAETDGSDMSTTIKMLSGTTQLNADISIVTFIPKGL